MQIQLFWLWLIGWYFFLTAVTATAAVASFQFQLFFYCYRFISLIFPKMSVFSFFTGRLRKLVTNISIKINQGTFFNQKITGLLCMRTSKRRPNKCNQPIDNNNRKLHKRLPHIHSHIFGHNLSILSTNSQRNNQNNNPPRRDIPDITPIHTHTYTQQQKQQQRGYHVKHSISKWCVRIRRINNDMADLESIIEFSIEFYKFHNVDLFQRGWVNFNVFFNSKFFFKFQIFNWNLWFLFKLKC